MLVFKNIASAITTVVKLLWSQHQGTHHGWKRLWHFWAWITNEVT